MDNYVGKRLDGRYEVQEIIGVGGMSVVYKAYDNVDDRIVAIKILKEEFLNNEEFKRRFKNESKAIALLSHPNIVKVYDVNFGEKLQYIVMEYIDGITLKEYINKQGAITWNDALFFMTQILRAVQHAHDKGIVHRDIKPQNIILLKNGNIKVTDFGIARFSRSETRTLTEQAIGSVHYIAPEQAKGEYTDEKADIYSLGVVLYEMLAGSVPFEADSAVSVALMQLQADAKKLTDINPDIPLGLEQICIHAMQKDPMDRYQTATEMLLDIEEIIKDPKATFNYVSKVDTNPTIIVNKNEVLSREEQHNDEVREHVDAAEAKEHKKKVITAVTIGIIVLIAAIVLLVMGFTNGFSKSTTKLENFVGTSYDETYDAYSSTYEIVAEYEKTSEYTPGTVISQDPVAGSKVLQGTKVKLTVAASEQDITVPNVYNYDEDRAKQALEMSGLKHTKTVSVSSENVDDGKVVYTEPKANTVVSADQEITIYISSGPSTTVIKTYKVPDVDGLTQSTAENFLKKTGFKNISFVTQDSPIAKGIVISQSPAAGATAKETDSIKVVISSGLTTTTTEKMLKTSVSIQLPRVIDKNGNYGSDTINVSVDGSTYLNQTVTLNGKTLSMKVSGKNNVVQSIQVSLVKTGATETKTTNGKNNQNFTIDFSGFSLDERNDTTEATKKNNQ
ncbi:MAG: Stk1 family PASTA domain-containing Ser/Thr kinase [Oscillospiraceae bacterium]|nr:Stk1 family PASTA domain-containing Ser/Thr kinase [Oscillospiraceae bacterium]